MHRYATASRSTFDELFDQARSGTVTLAAAVYPPICGDRSGDVRLSLGPTGAMIVHVDPGECSAKDFRLKVLFETGTCVFSTPADLCAFWTGPLAAAFGIAPAQAGDEHPAIFDQDSGPAEGEAPGDKLTAALPPPAAAAAADGTGEATAAAVEPRLPAPVTERRLTTATLSDELARVVHGQRPALERVASATVAQLAKRHPARPGSVLLVGPPGVGKTTTVEALPAALQALGRDEPFVFRLDCGELTDSIQVTRLLGSPPGYSGHAASTPLLTALERPGCILLVDEIDRAHPDVLDLLLGLLDAGRVTSPTGRAVDARHVVVALTTSVASDELAQALLHTPLEDRWVVERTCVEHLRRAGLRSDFVGRIGAFAAYAELDDAEALQGVAEAAVTALGREYGLIVEAIEPTVIAVVEDIARDRGDAAGARGLHHAARELLAESFAALAGDGPRTRVAVEAGPPLAVRPCRAAATAT